MVWVTAKLVICFINKIVHRILKTIQKHYYILGVHRILILEVTTFFDPDNNTKALLLSAISVDENQVFFVWIRTVKETGANVHAAKPSFVIHTECILLYESFAGLTLKKYL